MNTEYPSEAVSFEAFDLIGSTTILGILYGITFTLYCLFCRSLYLQRGKFTLGYTSLLLFCTTTYLALSVHMIRLTYVNHDRLPEGSSAYQEPLYGSPIDSCEAAKAVFGTIVEVLAMAIQVSSLSDILCY